MAAKYEYLIEERFPKEKGKPEPMTKDYLDALGAQGWQLNTAFSDFGHQVFVFMRQID